VKNCTFEDTDNGLRIKSRRERGGRVESITYENCTIKNCHPAISIMTYYQNSTHDKFPKDDKAQAMTDTTPQFKNITIKNVTGNSTKEAGLIVGLPESPIENLVLENVTLSGKEGLTIANAKGVVLKNVKITPESGEPVIIFNTTGEGLPEAKK
jgi:polygalacturonase